MSGSRNGKDAPDFVDNSDWEMGMASTDELAHALITVLQSSASPEPLRVDLKNHSSREGSHVLRAIIDSATATHAPLQLVVIDPGLLMDDVAHGIASAGELEGVAVRLDPHLSRSLELYRQAPE